jgi:hypothetical protein
MGEWKISGRGPLLFVHRVKKKYINDSLRSLEINSSFFCITLT